MKDYIFNLNELQELVPFFRSRFGTYLGKKLFKWCCVDKVNEVYRGCRHFRGSEFTSSVLKTPLINISYRVHNSHLLDNLPEGAFTTVSNHPIGSLDGIILIDIFAFLRPDFKVMVNGILTSIEAMGDNFISVTPDSNKQGANLGNVNGIRASFSRLKEGHPMGFFPAGAISCYDKTHKVVRDNPWIQNIVRLIRKSKIDVYPIYFDFYNSRFFYWLGQINWKIRSLRIPAEVFNKCGKTVDVYIGEPIPASRIQEFEDDDKLADFLYCKTYEAKREVL